jgi:siroheme synthase-like protein
MTASFPVALKLEARPCLVVGNGDEALRRLEALSGAGARVSLVSRAPSPELEARAQELGAELLRREYQAADLEGIWLAVCCEQDTVLASRMGTDADARQVFFCAIDQPAPSSFSHVALARSGPLFVAIGTEGKAPALARRLKHEFARVLGTPAVAEFIDALVRLRETTPAERRAPQLTRAARRLRLEGAFVVDDAED